MNKVMEVQISNAKARKYLFYSPLTRKKPFAQADGFFQLNPPAAEEIHLRWMKSLRDEIPLRGAMEGGFNFI